MSKVGESIAERWRRIQLEIESAISRRSSCWSHPVKVVAVTKGQSLEVIQEARAEGLGCFGENYVQEALSKQEVLPRGVELEWHFIGHLQTNKVRKVINRFNVIHSVDRLGLIAELDRQVEKANAPAQRVLVEVNLSGEQSKSGAALGHLDELIQHLKQSPHLILEGLMTMPPAHDSAERSRVYFRQLAETRAELEIKMDCSLPHLSMGTSQDYAVAIEEGATIVRLGSVLLGARKGREL